jgi:hypothetical protein
LQIALALCVIAALGGVNCSAGKYPAGVDPHLCPNYPHCDNALLGAHARAVGAVTHAYAGRAYAAPAYASHAYDAAPAYATHGHAPVVPVAEGYPAGVHPHTCPNYPYCGPTPAHVPTKIWAAPAAYAYAAPAHNVWAAAPASYPYGAGYAYASPAKGGDRYPAGVDPHACPNYPYCH